MNRGVRRALTMLVGLVVFLLSCFVLAILSDIIVDASPGTEVTNSGGKVAVSLVTLAVFFLVALALAYQVSRLVRSWLTRA